MESIYTGFHDGPRMMDAAFKQSLFLFLVEFSIGNKIYCTRPRRIFAGVLSLRFLTLSY